MLIQRQTSIDSSLVPRCSPKSTESYVAPFFCECYLSTAPAEWRSVNIGEHAGTSVTNKPIGTTRWYDFLLLIGRNCPKVPKTSLLRGRLCNFHITN
jgi:hypothetical protein